MNDAAAKCFNDIILSIGKAIDNGVSEQARDALRKVVRVAIDERKKLYEGNEGSGVAVETVAREVRRHDRRQ
jgi:hypothetical protein